jgi:hypothetical protein
MVVTVKRGHSIKNGTITNDSTLTAEEQLDTVEEASITYP